MSASIPESHLVRGARGVAIRCDGEGRILEVLRCDLGFADPPHEGELLSKIAATESEGKFAAFERELFDTGYAFDWEINCLVDGQVTPLGLTGVGTENGYLVVAFESRSDAMGVAEMFLAVNNELVNSVRSLEKRVVELEGQLSDKAGEPTQ
jgi:hypothetical protein